MAATWMGCLGGLYLRALSKMSRTSDTNAPASLYFIASSVSATVLIWTFIFDAGFVEQHNRIRDGIRTRIDNPNKGRHTYDTGTCLGQEGQEGPKTKNKKQKARFCLPSLAKASCVACSPEIHRLLDHNEVVRAPVPCRVNGCREGGSVLMPEQLLHGLPGNRQNRSDTIKQTEWRQRKASRSRSRSTRLRDEMRCRGR